MREGVDIHNLDVGDGGCGCCCCCWGSLLSLCVLLRAVICIEHAVGHWDDERHVVAFVFEYDERVVKQLTVGLLRWRVLRRSEQLAKGLLGWCVLRGAEKLTLGLLR